MLQEIIGAVNEVERQKCRGLVITSGCKTTFSAGLNLNEVYQAKPEVFQSYWRLFQELALRLYKAPFLTVAAINGHAIAGGCVLSLTFDYRIMLNSPDAKKPFRIGLNESIIGLVAPIWIQKLMIKQVGRRAGAMALLKGTLFSSEEALNIGLIDETAGSSEATVKKALEWLEGFEKYPIHALAGTKLTNRQKFITEFELNRENDLKSFSERTLSKETQDILGEYFLAMKKK